MYIHVNDSRKKYINENKDTIYQNLQDRARAVLMAKFISVNACVKNKNSLKSTT